MSIDLILQNNDNLLPREEVRVERVKAAPYPDGRRVHVEVTVTPFRERPNLEITIINAGGKTVSSTSAIAIMNFRVTFTLHLRGVDDPAGGIHGASSTLLRRHQRPAGYTRNRPAHYPRRAGQ
jgi:hypothetical protein